LPPKKKGARHAHRNFLGCLGNGCDCCCRVILAAVFDQSPLLAIILISLALCVYIAIRNRFDVEDEIGVRNFLDQREPEGTRDKGDSRFHLMLRVDTHGDLDPSSERNVVPVAGHFVFNEGARRLLTWPARRFWNRGSAAAKIPTGAAEDKKSRAPSRGSVGY
jgi:hypothetical protein